MSSGREAPSDEELAAWPNCATPDCEHKACTWAATTLCHPCATRVLGAAEMERRYNATHPITWQQAIALKALEDEAWEGE